MFLTRRSRYQNDDAAAPTGGGSTSAPAVVAPAPAEPVQTAAPVTPPSIPESLLKAPPPAPAAVDPNADPLAWLPTKYRVLDADGKLDMSSSSKKLSEGYTSLEKKLGGGGEAPPALATDYKFTPPEALKDIALDDELSAKFRETAHKAGFTQAQYQAAVEASLSLVPQVLDGALKLSADDARAELSKVWQSPAQFTQGLDNAQRAVDAAPAHVREALWTRLGRDPEFLQFASHFGAQMREDRAPVNQDGGAGGGTTVEALMAHPAFRDPRHPQHAQVSAQVQAHFKRQSGEGPAMQ